MNNCFIHMIANLFEVLIARGVLIIFSSNITFSLHFREEEEEEEEKEKNLSLIVPEPSIDKQWEEDKCYSTDST